MLLTLYLGLVSDYSAPAYLFNLLFCMSHGSSQGSEAETMKARLGATRTDHSCVPTKKHFALFSSTKMNAIIHPQEKSMDIDVIGIIYPACICQTKPQELLSIWKKNTLVKFRGQLNFQNIHLSTGRWGACSTGSTTARRLAQSHGGKTTCVKHRRLSRCLHRVRARTSR